jgi:hypothetical protein
MDVVDYSTQATPDDYKCSVCGATGVKLWRESYSSSVQLLCAFHAGEKAGVSIEGIDAEGMLPSELGRQTDQIGYFLPAVPTEDNQGYYGYTSVPEEGVNWWSNLPTLPEESEPVA